MTFEAFHAARRYLRSLTPARADARPCYYCLRPMHWVNSDIPPGPKNMLRGTIDHRIPLVRHGWDDWSNRVFACWACNYNKAWLTDEEFVTWTGGSGRVEHIAERRSDFLLDLFHARAVKVPMLFWQRRTILTRQCDQPLHVAAAFSRESVNV